MPADTDTEVLRLRGVLRDLVALSAIPAAWIGREPPTVAAGLADALAGLLQLEFVFVRLSDPGGAGAVEVTRGDAWQRFPDWLEGHPATTVRFRHREIIPDVGSGSEPCRGVAVPIGVNGEGGVVAAACQRSDFPTAMDQLMLSLAANHAATAFQGARLVQERKRAEEELREARNELEVKVTERTAELRRSQTYLAEAQRLTHTGSFAVKAPTQEPTHSSDEHSRMYGFNPEQAIPSLGEFLQRIHPEDRSRCSEALARGIREAAHFEVEYRVVLPQSPVKHLRAVGHPVFNAAGELDEFVGTVVDVSERKHAEKERRAQLWFFESMDGINRAIQRTSDLEQMLGAVLDVAIAIFNCDRAWLIYPCDPAVESHRVRMERTQPGYTGAFGLGAEIPNDPEVAGMVRAVLASGGPVRFDPESGHSLPSAPAARFSIRSMIAMAVHPKMDKPYIFGLHQCSHARIWTSPEERLFQEIGRRLADALDTLLVFRDLRESEQKLERSRAELGASRARIVTAADEARRRIERDLHDGIQQRLVSLALKARTIEMMTSQPADNIQGELSLLADGLGTALDELREISRGIHPAILSEAGLGPALQALARRSAVPVELDLKLGSRLAEPLEVAAYYIASEACANAVKHAQASVIEMRMDGRGGVLTLSIRDDGIGGADPSRGSGIIGLKDRVEALGGEMSVLSPPGRGTTLRVQLPVTPGTVLAPPPGTPR